MFDKLKNLFKKSKPSVEAPPQDKIPLVEIETKLSAQKKPRKPREKKVEKPVPPPVQESAKDIATRNNEPYINVIGMDVDPSDPHSGAFTFDYNEKFIINLVKAGYKLKQSDTDEMLVDRWFQNVCRNIALEMYEQETADPDKRALENLRIIRSRDIGDGRSEVS
jgi:hypothetical protein